MEKTVLFRDYQKAQTQDFLDMQSYAQQSFDDIVNDLGTNSLRYAGFNTVKSNTAEITVAPGRFYGANSSGQIGAVYSLPSQTIMSLVQYLAISQVTQKILTLVVYGVTNQEDIETRDFLTNTTTLQTQPQSVAMTQSRDAVLAILAGAEGSDPTPPALNVGQVAIANIVVDANGVVSVTMLPDSQIISTEDLNARLEVVEDFDAQIGPRVTALASDLASLQNEFDASTSKNVIIQIMQNVAELMVDAGLPESYSYYGASSFLYADSSQFDVNNTLSLGFNCDIEYGVRFPAANANEFALSMFNPLDPNANYNASSGLLLPAYGSVRKLVTGSVVSAIAMGQYTYQTFGYQEIDIPYMRIRNGGSYTVCTNGVTSYTAGDGSTPAWWLPNFQEYELTDSTYIPATMQHPYSAEQTNYYWIDTWTEPYWTLDETDHSINGALMAQSFLNSSDAWITRIGFYISTIASPSADINMVLCLCTNGQPDMTQVIATGIIPSAQIVASGINYVTIAPTFLQKGQRAAVVLVSNANHQIGMAAAGSYMDGTFFYSLDGTYFLGDFTKELYLEIWTAQFSSNQVTIQLNSLNLAGGIRNIDLTVRAQIPASCELIYEVQPDGSSTWLPITADDPLVPFQNAPVLCAFRARFVGSSDIMPGLVLPDSICKIWVPTTTFTYVSVLETLAAPTTSMNMTIRVENFNLQAHSLDSSHGNLDGYIALYFGGPPMVRHLPTTMTYELVDASMGAYEITLTWTSLPSTDNFALVIHGSTNSVSDVFHVAQVIWWEA